MPWLLVADAVLVLHTAVVLFVVGGLAAIIVGNLKGWRSVNRPTFRWLHLAMISVVVLQAWLDELCPLTLLESWLRMRGGEPGYPTAFIAHWLHRLLYWRPASCRVRTFVTQHS